MTAIGLLNDYYKGSAPIYMLPKAPDEQSTPAQSSTIASDNPDGQVHPYLWTFLSRLSRTTSRWWFVTELTPFSQSRMRSNDIFCHSISSRFRK